MLFPSYASYIIVGLVNNKEFNWYVTEKELWILDYSKDDIVLEDLCNCEREGILVLDETTINKFIEKISDYKMDTERLTQLFLSAIENDKENAAYDYAPSLYINFDDRALYSMYPEYTSFEEYIPNNWVGKYENFFDLIDNKFRYWKIKNINYLERFYDEK